MLYTWYFTPDEADIASCKGVRSCVLGDGAYETESKAIWHGKQWLKETSRTGIIEAVKAPGKQFTSYILDI